MARDSAVAKRVDRVAGAAPDAFRHEAFLYADEAEFLDVTARFVRGGIEAGEPVLVVVDERKGAALRAAVGDTAGGVEFADMAHVGGNPARIIPVWRQFVTEHGGPGRRLRGIGEPIWPEREPDELVECQIHETLLNVAFAGDQPWWLLCPYDAGRLDDAVLDAARSSHPHLLEGGRHGATAGFDDGPPLEVFERPLPEPPPGTVAHPFGAGDLGTIRRIVDAFASACELEPVQAADLVLCVNELATNSLRHGGGSGTLAMWVDGDRVMCEVADTGRLDDPLAGRRLPPLDLSGGRGLFLVNQLCDLVQLRSTAQGTTVRVHFNRSRGGDDR